MMIFTHVLMGALLAAGVSLLYPASSSLAVGAGLVGGAFPDLDMVFTHRRTLHFPVLFSLASLVLGGAAVVHPSSLTVGAFCFALAAAAHSLTDVLGGGKEMRPWRETDDRAVYNHVTKRWLAPWRIFYDGSAADLGLSAVLAVLLFLTSSPGYRGAVVAIFALAAAYTLLRRWITRQISDDYATFSAYIQHKLGRVFRNG